MPKFQSKPVKPLIIEALRMERETAFSQEEGTEGLALTVKPGDWLVHYANGNLAVYTDAELLEEFEPVRGASNGHAASRPARRKRRPKTNPDGTPRRGPGRPRKATPLPTPSPTQPSPSPGT